MCQRGANAGATTVAGTGTSDDLADRAAYRIRPGLGHDVIDIGVPAHRPAGDVVRQRRARHHQAAWRRLVPPIPAATSPLTSGYIHVDLSRATGISPVSDQGDAHAEAVSQKS